MTATAKAVVKATRPLQGAERPALHLRAERLATAALLPCPPLPQGVVAAEQREDR